MKLPNDTKPAPINAGDLVSCLPLGIELSCQIYSLVLNVLAARKSEQSKIVYSVAWNCALGAIKNDQCIECWRGPLSYWITVFTNTSVVQTHCKNSRRRGYTICICAIRSRSDVVVRIRHWRAACHGLESQKSLLYVVAGRASHLNSLLSSNKASLLTREQTPWPRTGINNGEYKWKHKMYPCNPLMGIWHMARWLSSNTKMYPFVIELTWDCL